MVLYKDKLDWILPKIDDKDVLDLGCVRHDIEETKKGHWLHGLIVEHAKSALGVDYLEREINILKGEGYNVVCANVETMSVGGVYEVVVAGDLIEHLNNFGSFIERVKAHMGNDGVFLVTTPNPVNLMRFVKVLFSGKAGANPEHTCWFTEQTLLQLARRYGLKPIEISYVDDSNQYYEKAKWRPFIWMSSAMCRIRNSFAETLCIAFVRE
jgi:2-polyprenyl-3-methyl-5-hydroxy-6-metoxy-1,4-benzoquinol methylase